MDKIEDEVKVNKSAASNNHKYKKKLRFNIKEEY